MTPAEIKDVLALMKYYGDIVGLDANVDQLAYLMYFIDNNSIIKITVHSLLGPPNKGSVKGLKISLYKDSNVTDYIKFTKSDIEESICEIFSNFHMIDSFIKVK